MIDLKQELQNYPYIDLKSIEENSVLPDNIKNSIILYNKALESLKYDSEDIAIIELKKAIAMNPGFHEAMNLLGVCYCYTKEYGKAAELFNRVIAAENNSINALKYLKAINLDEGTIPVSVTRKSGVDKKTRVGVNDTKVVSAPAENLKKVVKPDMVKYITGCIIGALIVVIIGFLFIPGKNAGAQGSKDVPDKVVSDKSSQYEAQYNKLNDDFQKLKNDLQASNAEVDYYKNAMKLFDVERLVSERNNEAAADMLILLKTVNFKEAEKARYDMLCNNIMPTVARALYFDGVNLYNARKYDEAIKKFEKLQTYNVDFQYADAALYIMGRCYVAVNNSKSAIEAFQKIKIKYPKSRYAVWADGRISELTAVP